MYKRYRSEADIKSELRSKLLVSRMYNAVLTCMMIALCFFFMGVHNKTVEIKDQEISSISIERDNAVANYDFLTNQYSGLVETINELNEISETLDSQNKELAASNEAYYTELETFRTREELYNKYEYALVNQGERTDITFEQLVTLEDLVEDSTYIKDPDLILAIVMTESAGNENATNSVSTAKGFGQFLNSTSQFTYTKLLGRSNWTPSVALNGDNNLEMMVAYIDYLYSVKGMDTMAVLRSYRGKEDITDYVNTMNSYLKSVDKSVQSIQYNLIS